jgi:hypothetical protein
MIHLELTAEEANLLRAVLQAYLDDLRMEISDTENYDLRNELKAMDVFLKDLLRHRLPPAPTTE